MTAAEHTIRGDVWQLDQLRGEDGEYLAGTVNVVGYVYLADKELHRLPVQFGAVSRHFSCSWNRLTTLEGAPHTVGGYFNCSNNRLTSLEGVHRIILRRVDEPLHIWGNSITAGGIGLILVEGLTKIISFQPPFEIIERHLGQGKAGLLRCQEALHDAGYGEYARL